MIEIKLTGACEGCRLPDLEFDYIEKVNGYLREKIWIAKCKNEDICAMWRAKQEERNETD